MERVTCAFCGLPFSVRRVTAGPYFCCSGCALASRVPMNGENLPVSRELIIALALGFAVFNEFLLAVFGGALIADARANAGTRMFWGSAALGAVALVVQLFFLLGARTHRWSDWVVGSAAIGLTVWSGWRATQSMFDPTECAWALMAANLVLILWASRGWLRRAIFRRRIGTKS